MNAAIHTLPRRLELTLQQRAAYDALSAFASGDHGARMMTLEGYAGTGKTTLVGELIRAVGQKLRVAVAAPTNKAVAVLQEKIGDGVGANVDFGSIHSFLGLRLQERDDGRHECVASGESSLHAYELAIVDECSMVGRDLFSRIVLTATSSGTRVLFVGDPAQLPPVENSTDPSPTFTHVQHKAVLTDVVRQAADNPIIALSMEIRAAIEAGERMQGSTLAKLLPTQPADALFATGGAETATAWALHDIREGHDTRILAFRNATVLRYNTEIHAALHGTATPFAPGETVMMQEAHEAQHAVRGGMLRAAKVVLFNSEELVVRAIEEDRHPKHEAIAAWRLILERDNGTGVAVWVPVDAAAIQREVSRCFSEAGRLKAELQLKRDSTKDDERRKLIARAWSLRNDFASVRHIYAMTVHKSQGSTLYTAIVDLCDVETMRDDFAYNRALYVATTRASQRLAFVA